MKSPTCAICGKPPADRYAPFCSVRCADVDLGRWFGETYRIPDTTTDPDERPPTDGEDDNMTG